MIVETFSILEDLFVNILNKWLNEYCFKLNEIESTFFVNLNKS